MAKAKAQSRPTAQAETTQAGSKKNGTGRGAK